MAQEPDAVLIDRLRIPILQAPTGSIAGPELCSAVTNAGGMGAMGVTWTDGSTLREWIQHVRASVSERLFQVNYVLHFSADTLAIALEEGVPVVTFSWGLPTTETSLVRSFGAGLGIQVGSFEGAKRALDLGPDFLIAQGLEAGGHVQSSTAVSELLPELVALAGQVPVVAAGGLADGSDISQVLCLGARAAMLGTRFVATEESRAHPEYKRALVNGSRTALTSCFDGGWPAAQHRVLRNPTLDDWEAAGCPTSQRPGEGEVVGTIDGADVIRYDDIAPRTTTTGRIEEMCLYAGAGVGKVRDVPRADDLVRRLWREAQNAR